MGCFSSSLGWWSVGVIRFESGRELVGEYQNKQAQSGQPMRGQAKGMQSQTRLASGPRIPHFSKVKSWLSASPRSYLSLQMMTSAMDSWWWRAMALATLPILALISIVNFRVIASLGISISACLIVNYTLGVTSSGSSQMGIWQTGGSYYFFFFFPFFFFFLGAISLSQIYKCSSCTNPPLKPHLIPTLTPHSPVHPHPHPHPAQTGSREYRLTNGSAVIQEVFCP